MFQESCISLFGRQLKPFDKQNTQQDVAFLMDYSTPIGNVDMFLVEVVQFINRYCIDNAVGYSFYAFQ